MIRSISLKNLLSFGDPGVTLALRPLNVLIGANGSGKSNLIDAISLLQAAPRDIAEPVRNGGGLEAWIHRSGSNRATGYLSVEIEPIGNAPHAVLHGLYFTSRPWFAIASEDVARLGGARPVGVFAFAEEGPSVLVGSDNSIDFLAEDYDERRSVVSQLRGDKRLPEILWLAREYESIRIYRDWTFGRKTALRVPQRADEKNDHLADDASNLGLILSRFRNDSQAKKRLLSELKSFMDGVVDFNVLVEGGTVQLFLEEFDRTIPATRLSDGTLRYLALLAILCDPSPPRLVCIEEPELGLHPDVLPNIARLMVEASARTQLIVTTHSDVIVDALTDHPDSIVVCERGEDGSRMQRLDPEKLKPWLESYRLGQLWSKGEIGGNRW